MEVSAGSSLTADQYRKLTDGLPLLSELSNTILVPYPAYRLTTCTVIWLNYRWFSERGFRLENAAERTAIERWMIESFGYVSNPPDVGFRSEEGEKTFHADRYGSNNTLFAHGGSGRGAAVGHFHAKGVGPTPLVGKGVNREHSHGNASLNVAIREAIYSEIAANEFPAGAVPVIGILDAGIPFESSSTPGKMLRRAIIVRPGMLRPAHIQRAAGFIEPADGHRNSQVEDAARTRDLVRHVTSRKTAQDDPLSRIREFFRAVAQQIAFGQVHRIYNGGYFSSNLTLDGELLDFGNTYVFPDWCNAKVLDNDMGFGRELSTLALTAHSITFHLRKYAGISISSSFADELVSLAGDTYRDSFEIEVLRLWGLTQADDDAELALRFTKAMYKTHQKVTVNYSLGQSSNMTALRQDEQADEKTASAGTEAVVDDMMQKMRCTGGTYSQHRRMRISAQRYLRYRRSSDRGWLQHETEKLISSLPDDGGGGSISAFIDDCIGKSRRHWPMLPLSLLVVAQAIKLDGAALYCFDESSRPVIWLEGSVYDGVLTVLGKDIEIDRIKGLRTRAGRGGVSSEVSSHEDRLQIDLLGIEAPIPTIVYDGMEFERFRRSVILRTELLDSQ